MAEIKITVVRRSDGNWYLKATGSGMPYMTSGKTLWSVMEKLEKARDIT